MSTSPRPVRHDRGTTDPQTLVPQGLPGLRWTRSPVRWRRPFPKTAAAICTDVASITASGSRVLNARASCPGEAVLTPPGRSARNGSDGWTRVKRLQGGRYSDSGSCGPTTRKPPEDDLLRRSPEAPGRFPELGRGYNAAVQRLQARTRMASINCAGAM